MQHTLEVIMFLTIDEIRKIQLEILSYVHDFCIDNNIKYFINYGTLLGAIRHKGYIPWDDDIDIMMSRENYETFISLFSLINSKYKIMSLKTSNKYYNNFIKVYDNTTIVLDEKNEKTYDIGINIDIFPYDSFNDKRLVDKTYILESFKLLSIAKLHDIQYGDSKVKDIIRHLFWLLLRPISPRFFCNRIDNIIQKKICKNGKYFGLLASKFKYSDIFTSDVFSELIDLPFEDKLFKAPKNYDYILRQYYGDYMQLPPEEKRINPHNIRAYYKN